MTNETLYDILQVSKTADSDIIDAAYARLREKYQDNETGSKVIKMAYDTLSDPVRRVNYDQRFKSQSIPSRRAYRIPVGSMADSWWRSSTVSCAAILIAAIISLGMVLNYAKHRKEVSTVSEVINNDARRVETERVYVDRAMDNQDRQTDLQREALERSAERARAEQERLAAETEARIAQQNERLRLQREQQEFSMQQRLNAERRLQEDRARILALDRLERDRRELCRLERYRYNRTFSCP
jgi:curved DNA-binding protein CbpA